MLVGLDWVFTHYAFNFCMSHVHAFFMHTFYLFFPILCCDVFCSLSLSLSRINYAMAPKACKSTLAQNPLQGSGFSSSDPPVPPLHVRFCDEKARKDFLENFQKCGIHSEHQVILSNFADTPLPSLIRTRGWESLLERSLRCPVMFI